MFAIITSVYEVKEVKNTFYCMCSRWMRSSGAPDYTSLVSSMDIVLASFSSLFFSSFLFFTLKEV